MNNIKEIELITVEEMGQLFKISRSKTYSLIKEKDFPSIKIGKCIRINKIELLSWLQNKNML
jgi:excisionase family DNA binding protein